MALRNQPYIPLYVQDFLTDEKLNMCSITSQGVYIKLMCLFHKSNEYGGILLKQKDKQTTKQNMKHIDFFALKVAKLLPIDLQTITDALIELVEEGVLIIDGDFIYQKRMVKDNKVSEIRAEAGKLGGKKNSEKVNFAKAKVEANIETKAKQNTEYECEFSIDTDIDIDLINKGVAIKKNEWQNLDQKKWVEDNCPTLLTMTKPLTNEGLNKLISEFGMTKVEDKLIAMENVLDTVVGSKSKRDDVVHLMSTLKAGGEDGAQAINELRAGLIEKLREVGYSNVTSATADNLPSISTAKVVKYVRDLDEGGKLDVIMGKKNAENLRDFADLVQIMNVKRAGAINQSNTGSILTPFIEAAVSGMTFGVPFPAVTAMREAVKMKNARALERAVESSLRRQNQILEQVNKF